MSNVTLQVGGHSFTIACAEGEEEHVRGLGGMIDGKLQGMPNVAGQSEARTLLYASLLLADELHELREKQPRQGSLLDDEPEDLPVRLEALAEKFENLAALLER